MDGSLLLGGISRTGWGLVTAIAGAALPMQPEAGQAQALDQTKKLLLNLGLVFLLLSQALTLGSLLASRSDRDEESWDLAVFQWGAATLVLMIDFLYVATRGALARQKLEGVAFCAFLGVLQICIASQTLREEYDFDTAAIVRSWLAACPQLVKLGRYAGETGTLASAVASGVLQAAIGVTDIVRASEGRSASG